MLDYYKELLNYNKIPFFLKKYLKCPSLKRLKKISYFCGMDFASKDIYDFGEIVTRFDHSLTVALLIYKLTKNKKATIAGLFHDVATPCFSHVIDYMNKDYETQESTEVFTEKTLKNDKYFNQCLKKDKIQLKCIVDFKKYSIVDNKRPKLCADRLDGIILTGLFWTKTFDKIYIKKVLDDIRIFQNEDKEYEIGFNSYNIAEYVLKVSEDIDIIAHSNEDNYMMELLAKMTRYAIDNNYIKYEDLYIINEDYLYNTFENINDNNFKKDLRKFKTIKKEEVEILDLPNIKRRKINPIVKGKRLL